MTPKKAGFTYIGVSACAICHDGAGRILLNLRGRTCRDEWGKWDNCGGSLKFGEQPEACLRRELQEEYACQALECQFGGIVNTIRQVHNQTTHWLILAYLVRIDPRQARNGEPNKFDEVRWFDITKLPANRHSFFDRDFAQVKHLWDDFYHSKP
jgi:8-oxo-dGTP pyrophosphatase MutT (NUDIX family)